MTVKTLATIMSDAKAFFVPLPEELLRDPKDQTIIHPFWKNCSPEIRVYVGIITRVRAVLVGTSALISNDWLRKFAGLDRAGLYRAVRVLSKELKLISVRPGSQRAASLYRLNRPRTGKPYPSDEETDIEATARLEDSTDVAQRRNRFALMKWGTSRTKKSDDDSWGAWPP